LTQPPLLASHPELTDTILVQRVGDGDYAAFQILMRQGSRRLFRIARVILKGDLEAEAALQETYVAAYSLLKTFRGDSNLSTWLSRILVNEALGRLDKQTKDRVVISLWDASHHPFQTEQAGGTIDDPTSSEDATLRAEMRALLEQELDELPIALRTVFVMRELEEMTVEETAECLGIPEATVRSRLSRAKSLFRTLVERETDLVLRDVFAFGGDRCERTVEAVLSRITKDANRT
jgi:RNA polymerase sigma-70 factor (ECF subfamily)